ncbi:hypothetical protein CBL_07174 [Carabus blaptoides fortunei]
MHDACTSCVSALNVDEIRQVTTADRGADRLAEMLKARSSPQTSRRMSASQDERAARGAKNVDNAAVKNTKVGTAKTKEDKGMDELEFPECSAINATVAASAKCKILCPATSVTVKVEAREKLREEIDKMVSNVQMISGVVKSGKRRSDKPSNNNDKIAQLTYAAATSKPTYSIRIKIESKSQTADETREQFRNAIDPRVSEIEIEKCKRIGNGAIMVTVNDKEDVEKIRVAVAANTKYQVKEVPKNRPRVKVFPIDESMAENEIIWRLHDLNDAVKGNYASESELTKDIKLR